MLSLNGIMAVCHKEGKVDALQVSLCLLNSKVQPMWSGFHHCSIESLQSAAWVLANKADEAWKMKTKSLQKLVLVNLKMQILQ